MKKLNLILFIILISFGCKETKKTEETLSGEITTVPEIEEDNLLKVVINARILVDDVFEVYYHESGEKTFHPKDFVFEKIKGKPENQDIILTLPEKTYPERLRLDFGKIKTQKEIKLNSIKLFYGTKEYLFTDSEIKNDFKASKYIDFDKDKMIIKTKSIDGKYDPYFYTKKVSTIVNFLIED